LVEAFIGHALAGAHDQAVALALSQLDDAVPEELVITELLAPALRQVGERWQANELSVADEHLVTSAAEASLYALANEARPETGGSPVAVACAEGDWHAVAAHMFAEVLRSRGLATTFLGASTPAEHVTRFLERHRHGALVVSCNLAIFFPGVAALVDAAHVVGVPVLAGGRALRTNQCAHLLGADGWAPDAGSSIEVLASWHQRTPPVRTTPARLDAAAIELDLRADELGAAAFIDLSKHFRAMSSYSMRQLAQTRQDLVYIVRFVAAAQLVNDSSVLTEFLEWLAYVLSARRVPRSALVAGLEALAPLLRQVSPQAGELAEVGARVVGTEQA
jgi:methanogenic corrinoid protein MtbC1